jgi:hypothetical protein
MPRLPHVRQFLIDLGFTPTGAWGSTFYSVGDLHQLGKDVHASSMPGQEQLRDGK